MMNIQLAVNQMRIQRKLGKLSNEQQTRILRRNGVNRMAQWERMMALRADIEKEIQPILQARRQAERETFQVKWQPDAVLPEENTQSRLSPLQMRLMDSKNRCLAKQSLASNAPTSNAPKKRGRPVGSKSKIPMFVKTLAEANDAAPDARKMNQRMCVAA